MKHQFKEYLNALNNHDIEKTLTFLSTDFQLNFAGSAFTLPKGEMVKVLGWDKAVNGSVSYDSIRVKSDSISGIFIEQNDFFKLLGIKELRSENIYIFDDSGLIVKQVYRLLPGQPSPQEYLKPVIKWANEHEPELLNEVYSENRIVYNEEMGIKWLQLLRKWKSKVQGK